MYCSDSEGDEGTGGTDSNDSNDSNDSDSNSDVGLSPGRYSDTGVLVAREF